VGHRIAVERPVARLALYRASERVRQRLLLAPIVERDGPGCRCRRRWWRFVLGSFGSAFPVRVHWCRFCGTSDGLLSCGGVLDTAAAVTRSPAADHFVSSAASRFEVNDHLIRQVKRRPVTTRRHEGATFPEFSKAHRFRFRRSSVGRHQHYRMSVFGLRVRYACSLKP